MFKRKNQVLTHQSFFLLGPRATGKTTWLKNAYPEAQYIDLLNSITERMLMASPERLEGMLTHQSIIIDEIQKIPQLLNEVHRLIENKGNTFILTGSSARKLRKGGVNLLAGRAYQRTFHPLTCWELGQAWDLKKALYFGLLPQVWNIEKPQEYLSSYVQLYLKEEVAQEGLTRNLHAFTRFLELVSFFQAQPLTLSTLSSDVGIQAKLIAAYIEILEDLLLAHLIPIFKKKAKRRMAAHPKFFFFDTGIYQILRPKGPLDMTSEINGASLETIFFQHHDALMEFNQWDQKLFYWRTALKMEVDFISYGSFGIFAFEIKHTSLLRTEELTSLKLFKNDYPVSHCYFLYGGDQEFFLDGIHIINFEKALWQLPYILQNPEKKIPDALLI